MAQQVRNSEGAPRFENGKAMLIAGLGGRYGDENRAQIPDLWGRFGPRYFGRVPGQVDKKSYGVCSNLDDRGNVDYLAGVEVSTLTGLPSELMHVSIAPARYAVFAHLGHISTIGRTWMNIHGAWLPKSGFAPAATPSFECYAETFDPAVAMDNVEIWIPIRA